MDLEEERQRNSRLEKMAPHSLSPEETEWETKKAIDDYKFKLQKAEQDINTLQTNVSKGYCSIKPFAPITKIISRLCFVNIALKYISGCSFGVSSNTI